MYIIYIYLYIHIHVYMCVPYSTHEMMNHSLPPNRNSIEASSELLRPGAGRGNPPTQRCGPEKGRQTRNRQHRVSAFRVFLVSFSLGFWAQAISRDHASEGLLGFLFAVWITASGVLSTDAPAVHRAPVLFLSPVPVGLAL